MTSDRMLYLYGWDLGARLVRKPWVQEHNVRAWLDDPDFDEPLENHCYAGMRDAYVSALPEAG